MAVIKLTMAYDGTYYHGWQRQSRLTTIQGTLERALRRLTGRSIRLNGAGRTDAGVHAFGQVAHFVSATPFDMRGWVRALNALLPDDVVVHSAETVPDAFHARFSAKGKTYAYFIHNGERRSPHCRRTAWFVPYKLNPHKMRAAAKVLIGDHDFTSFCASNGEGRGRRVCLKRIRIEKREDQITITLEAPRFLQYMVRNIVGLLVEIGKGRRRVDEVSTILKSKDRRMAGPTAPPQGLFLVKVAY
ncbi:MAG: tRNA pseudouridine(38-40) synthase TruA [Nitrospiria bacterium]